MRYCHSIKNNWDKTTFTICIRYFRLTVCVVSPPFWLWKYIVFHSKLSYQRKVEIHWILYGFASRRNAASLNFVICKTNRWFWFCLLGTDLKNLKSFLRHSPYVPWTWDSRKYTHFCALNVCLWIVFLRGNYIRISFWAFIRAIFRSCFILDFVVQAYLDCSLYMWFSTFHNFLLKILLTCCASSFCDS